MGLYSQLIKYVSSRGDEEYTQSTTRNQAVPLCECELGLGVYYKYITTSILSNE